MEKFKIYMINEARTNGAQKAFMPWRWVCDTFSFAEYDNVYEGEIEPKQTPIATLDSIFCQLGNYGSKPAGYEHLRSLSVGDIIEYQGEKYFVDSLGFVQLSKDILAA